MTTPAQLVVGPFRVRIRSSHEDVARHLSLMYEGFPTWEGDGACHFELAIVHGRRHHRWIKQQAVLSVNGIRPYLPLEATLAAPVLEWGLNHCIGLRAHQLVSVHAAVVERDGHALILPAPSGAGKSTLCAALTFSGWRLFSDEFALLDPATGQLQPSPRPLALKEGTIELIRRRHPDVVLSPERRDMEQFRFVHARPPIDSVTRAHEPADPRWIVLPRYVAGSRTIFEPITKAQAMMELIGQSFNYNYHADGFAALVRLVERCECHVLEYSDLDDVLPRLREMI